MMSDEWKAAHVLEESLEVNTTGLSLGDLRGLLGHDVARHNKTTSKSERREGN